MKLKKKLSIFFQVNLHERLIKFLLDVNLFYRSIKNFSFNDFAQYLRFDIQLLDRTHFASMIKERAQRVIKNVLSDLKDIIKIFVTCDVWTNLNKFVFLEITIYFIDKLWRFWEIFIAFKTLSDQHREKNLIEMLLNILKSYNLKRRVIVITTNNALNNQILRSNLTWKLAQLSITWNHQSRTFWYMSHVFQLIVNALLAKLKMQTRKKNIVFRFNVKELRVLINRKELSFENIVRKMNSLHFIKISIWV